MSDKPLKLVDIWHLVRDKDSETGSRALRETGIVLAMSFAPLVLGALLAYVSDHLTPDSYESFWHYLGKGMFGGQLFLVFLSLAGSNFSRLWDPSAPKVNFSGTANSLNVIGALICAGLLGFDESMSVFNFFPINALSALFMIIALFHYFCLSVPSYIEKIDPTEGPRDRGRKLADTLENASLAL